MSMCTTAAWAPRGEAGVSAGGCAGHMHVHSDDARRRSCVTRPSSGSGSARCGPSSSAGRLAVTTTRAAHACECMRDSGAHGLLRVTTSRNRALRRTTNTEQQPVHHSKHLAKPSFSAARGLTRPKSRKEQWSRSAEIRGTAAGPYRPQRAPIPTHPNTLQLQHTRSGTGVLRAVTFQPSVHAPHAHHNRSYTTRHHPAPHTRRRAPLWTPPHLRQTHTTPKKQQYAKRAPVRPGLQPLPYYC